MEIHILDWIMYFIIMGVSWIFVIPEDFKEEGLGRIFGYIIMLILSLTYYTIFYFYNWIDIFNSIKLDITW